MEYTFENKINELIGYRTKYLLEQINCLWRELEINSPEMSINLIDTIFIKGIRFQNGFKDAIRQIDTNSNQYLSIRFKINGKQHTLKSFGKIGKIKKQKIIKIIELVTLIKIVKDINHLSYLASSIKFLDNYQIQE